MCHRDPESNRIASRSDPLMVAHAWYRASTAAPTDLGVAPSPAATLTDDLAPPRCALCCEVAIVRSILLVLPCRGTVMRCRSPWHSLLCVMRFLIDVDRCLALAASGRPAFQPSCPCSPVPSACSRDCISSQLTARLSSRPVSGLCCFCSCAVLSVSSVARTSTTPCAALCRAWTRRRSSTASPRQARLTQARRPPGEC
jgi:hypothetical protein